MFSLISGFDDFISAAVASLRSDCLNEIARFITRLGDGGAVWIVLSLGLLCFQKTRKTGVFMLVALIITAVVGTLGLKNLIARARPCVGLAQDALYPCPSGYSFPSGHSISSFAAAGVLWFADRKYGAAALLFACLIALSRVWLNVHFATDVLVAAALGFLTAWLLSKTAAFPKRD